jgi:hypothetical protein
MARTGGCSDPWGTQRPACVPQVCPHLVNLAVALWKQPAETLTTARPGPDNRRSTPESPPQWPVLHTTGPSGRPERGETRRASNITLRRGREQYAIHRLTDGPGAVVPGEYDGGSATPGRPTGGFDGPKSRSVPFVGHPVSTGAACPRSLRSVRSWSPGVRGRAVPVGTRGDPYQHRPTSSGDCLADRRRDAPELHRSDAREQADLPAEQPPAPQGARLPAAHAHPRRPFHPVLQAAQGPQEPRGLILDATGS